MRRNWKSNFMNTEKSWDTLTEAPLVYNIADHVVFPPLHNVHYTIFYLDAKNAGFESARFTCAAHAHFCAAL